MVLNSNYILTRKSSDRIKQMHIYSHFKDENNAKMKIKGNILFNIKIK